MNTSDRLKISISVENNPEGWNKEARYRKTLSKSIDMLPTEIKDRVLDEVVFLVPGGGSYASFFYMPYTKIGGADRFPVILVKASTIDELGEYFSCKIVLHEVAHFILGSDSSEEEAESLADKWFNRESLFTWGK